MKISDLADLVVVRNHIGIVLNDKSVSEKTDFRKLNDIRIKLDKEFIKAVKDLNFDNLFPVDCTKGVTFQVTENLKKELGVISSDASLPKTGVTTTTVDGTQADSSLLDCSPVDCPVHKSVVVLGPKDEDETDTEDADMIAERVRQQKEQLKKEGRSNKRISKAKENATEK
jgi:hypothetical protein